VSGKASRGFSDNEQQLFAVNMGLTAQETKSNVLTEAAEQSTGQLNFTDKDATRSTF
jgi:hypothetical protein